MAMFAKNDQELFALIMKDFLPITKDAGDYVLSQVQQEIFDKVYSFPKSPFYDRREMSGGFVGSWVEETGINGLNEIDSTVFSDPYMMDLDIENFVHGSDYNGDQRANMSQNIIGAENYDFGGNAAIERDFWSPIESMVDDGKEIDKAFEAGMSKRGISFIKG